MEAYTDFAEVYDLFMDNVPYDAWAARITSVLCAHGIADGPVVDLGCGTGVLTRLLARRYDMTGVDASPDMLQIAVQTESPVLYLCQPMQELELDGCVRAVVSTCDAVNYVLAPDELAETFRRVAAALERGGVFWFDVNTDYKYRSLLSDHTFAESRDEGSFIWENFYDEAERLNEYDLTLFVPEKDGRFRRYQETHFQRCYAQQQLRTMLEEAGLSVVGVFDGYTEGAPRADSERISFLAVKMK